MCRLALRLSDRLRTAQLQMQRSLQQRLVETPGTHRCSVASFAVESVCIAGHWTIACLQCKDKILGSLSDLDSCHTAIMHI